MNKNRVNGTMNEVVGGAKRKAGELTDNSQLQVEGAIQQAKGKVENAWGMAKEAVRDVIEDSEVHLDAHVTLKSKNAKTDAECKKCK